MSVTARQTLSHRHRRLGIQACDDLTLSRSSLAWNLRSLVGDVAWKERRDGGGWGTSTNMMIEQAKEELEILEFQHPNRFQYLKMELKTFISDFESQSLLLKNNPISNYPSALTQDGRPFDNLPMVWGLFPVDPLPGEHPYYIFSKGTYKVGRRGCDIIINKDKGVSRIHAEIVVDEMMCMDHLQKKSSNNSSKVRIRDCSKYGTFINKNLGSKKNVHEFPNRETMFLDGDLVSFGTGNANYRFCFVSLVFFACSSKNSEMNQLQDKISLIGASITRTWSLQCTHVIIDDFISINDEIIDAIVAKKPLVRFSWIEYQFKKKLPLLLEVGGAKVVFVETQDSCSQVSTMGRRAKGNSAGTRVDSQERKQGLGDHLVCVTPAGTTSNTKSFHNFNSQPKVKERELVLAVVSGHLDPSIMASAPVLVTSSCSTDETVVADSDVEMETATSVPSVAINLIESDEDEYKEKIAINKVEVAENGGRAESIVHNMESTDLDGRGNTTVIRTIEHDCATLKPDCSYSTTIMSDYDNITLSREIKDGLVARKDRDHSSESENLDIIYSQNLIVRESNLPRSGHASISGGAIDFKRFRKTSAPSGNSFNNLIPFSKYPYEESDYGNEDVIESVKEEKKRKQMEAIAEDLFNNEKAKKRGAAGSLRGIFARELGASTRSSEHDIFRSNFVKTSSVIQRPTLQHLSP
ncbi:hypothetical protein RD792_013098 [Penstemon davidsonii]|uniref:FHA domain-containing protein n=1 Tax=Penstemon davidsonii TaxID=160366 RepID=A0ABR0CU27_9LAMI|nr:hypothetical protein RD792_013098 [Penstemon davidsonii]